MSSARNLREMFDSARIANPDISLWAVGSVTSTAYMFKNASAATLVNAEGVNGVANWVTNQIRDMKGMFQGAAKAVADTSKWDVGSVKGDGFLEIFDGAEAANASTPIENRR